MLMHSHSELIPWNSLWRLCAAYIVCQHMYYNNIKFITGICLFLYLFVFTPDLNLILTFLRSLINFSPFTCLRWEYPVDTPVHTNTQLAVANQPFSSYKSLLTFAKFWFYPLPMHNPMYLWIQKTNQFPCDFWWTFLINFSFFSIKLLSSLELCSRPIV